MIYLNLLKGLEVIETFFKVIRDESHVGDDNELSFFTNHFWNY